ncbi:MAG: MobA/MobL family protein [Defluviitaleaceae bacterium]|nr:MobA/MobL family protein [Defluviitaleaceae bacterium]
MAIFHLSVRRNSRASGRCALAASAYRTGDKLTNEQNNMTYNYNNRRGSAVRASAYRSGDVLDEGEKTHDFTAKSEVLHSEILLPSHAPREFSDRSTLWNAVETCEKHPKAQTFREIVVALPVELDEEQNLELLRDYVQKNFVDSGMCADFSYHAGHIHTKKPENYPFKDLTIQKENPHAHIMLTMRPLNEDETWGEKSRKEYILDRNGNRIKTASGNWRSRKIDLTDWEKPETLERWRENWASAVNHELKRHAIDGRISNLSLEKQGIDREPTKHMGHSAWNLERKGIKTEAGEKNREIMRRNLAKTPEKISENLHELKAKHFNLHRETSEIKREISHLGREPQIINATIEEITERAEHIKSIKNQVAELKAKRQNMGILANKKAIDYDIERYERTYTQSTRYFEHKYNISYENTVDKIEFLREETQEKQRKLERLQGRLEPLKAEQEKILLGYQRQKLLADISCDKQKIYNRLRELERQQKPQKPSAQYAIMRAENERLLDSISKRNFEIILKDLTPEQQKALIKLQEHEKIREMPRAFEREF